MAANLRCRLHLALRSCERQIANLRAVGVLNLNDRLVSVMLDMRPGPNSPLRAP